MEACDILRSVGPADFRELVPGHESARDPLFRALWRVRRASAGADGDAAVVLQRFTYIAAAVKIEKAQYVRNMVAHGEVGQVKPATDFLVGQTLHQKRKHVLLTFGEGIAVACADVHRAPSIGQLGFAYREDADDRRPGKGRPYPRRRFVIAKLRDSDDEEAFVCWRALAAVGKGSSAGKRAAGKGRVQMVHGGNKAIRQKSKR